MRVWDVPPEELCVKHLLSEHRELHGLWNIITQDKIGYSKHPETLRWVGKQAALYKRHDALVEEMDRRGYKHGSPLDVALATGQVEQTDFVNTLQEQREILHDKPCTCYT